MVARNPWIFALGAAGLWSTSAAAAGFLEGTINPATLVYLVQLVGLLVLSIYLAITKRLRISARRLHDTAKKSLLSRRPTRLVVGIIVFAVFLYLYQYLFYSAMTSPGRIFGNIANYFWPVLLILANFYIFSNDRQAPSFRTLLAMSVGLLGVCALVLVTGDGEPVGISPLLLGGGAAIAAAMYMGQSVSLVRSHDMDPPEIWWGGLLLSVVAQTLAAPFFLAAFANITIQELGVATYLGVFTVGVAQVIWTKAIATREDDVPYVLIYLTPVASTVIQMLLLSDSPSLGFFLGMTLVVASIFLTMRVYSTMIAEAGASVVFMYLGFLAFFSDRFVLDGWKNALSDMPVEVFGVLAAFLLARQWERIRAEAVALSTWAASLTDLHNHLRRAAVDPNKVKVRLRQELEDLFTAVVDFDQSSTITTSVSGYRSLNRMIEKYMQSSRALVPGDHEVESYIHRLQEHTGRWVGLKSHQTGISDIVALLALIAIVVFGYLDVLLRPAGEGVVGQIIMMSMISVFGFLVFRIQAYNTQPTFQTLSDMQRLQYEGLSFGLPLYLGDLNKLAISSWRVSVDRRIRYCVGSQRYPTEFGGDPRAKFFHHLRLRILGAWALLVGPALVAAILLYRSSGV
jgi:drug/metabolite transporter (DMT)-like permease